MIHVCNGMLLGHEKDEILPCVATGMDLEDIMLNKTSETEKDKCHMASPLRGT